MVWLPDLLISYGTPMASMCEWTKAVRRVLNVPYTTHTTLLCHSLEADRVCSPQEPWDVTGPDSSVLLGRIYLICATSVHVGPVIAIHVRMDITCQMYQCVSYRRPSGLHIPSDPLTDTFFSLDIRIYYFWIVALFVSTWMCLPLDD